MLLCSPASPYSSKVRMAALCCGFQMREQFVTTAEEPALLIDANPLGKIPTLLLDDGRVIFDSSVIVRYLDQQCGGLFGSHPDEVIENARLEALSDGITDAALSIVYERRFRPKEAIHEPWLERQWRKIVRSLSALESALPGFEHSPRIGAIGARVALAYLSLRFSGHWEERHEALLGWADHFDDAYPHLMGCLPADVQSKV
ncbi:glutathione S-transferase family protein [Ensifer adhaerens]|uniref:Glutathione S-transferase family protein n=1 Tax=Ensifer adhaerens TaxID=106592 RepID=A0A9Q8YI28_ENSAD|nr:glutathione S-transferase family protein [Ensifer adhaerens]USJ28521.1 glutathione S-transferase family protein [Ensifer adhaerens]